MTSCSGLALSHVAAASSAFRSLRSTSTRPDAKWRSGRFSRAENPAVGPAPGVGPAASSVGASGGAAASGHTGAGGGAAGAAAVSAAAGGPSACRAQPTVSSASAPSVMVTRAVGVIGACPGSGQLVALGQPIVQHAEAELELGRQGLELVEAIAVGAQTAVF